MFVYKCVLCQRALINEGVMCGPCVSTMEAFGGTNAKLRIDAMCKRTLEGMSTRIPPKSIYALTKHATIVAQWYAALQWIRELHVKAAIKSIVARRKLGKNPQHGFRDSNDPSEDWKDQDDEPWKGTDDVQ